MKRSYTQFVSGFIWQTQGTKANTEFRLFKWCDHNANSGGNHLGIMCSQVKITGGFPVLPILLTSRECSITQTMQLFRLLLCAVTYLCFSCSVWECLWNFISFHCFTLLNITVLLCNLGESETCQIREHNGTERERAQTASCSLRPQKVEDWLSGWLVTLSVA